MCITIEQAEAAIRAARKKASALNTPVCIAVVDSSGNLKSFYRMDDAWVGSIDLAEKKARTAAFFRMKTGQIGQQAEGAGPLYGIERLKDGLITGPGGIPIVDAGGMMSGAIGVSGSTVENDEAVAEAGARAIVDTALSSHHWRF